MTVLVTGGAGYIGSHMVLALIDAGHDVVVLDDFSTGFDWAVHPAATLVSGDVSDGELVRRLVREHQIDAVIHFAARIVVPESVADPLGYYLANTVKTRALIEAVVAAGVPHFIFSSTAAVYGMIGADPVAENAALAPISPYGRSKLMSEWMLADAAVAHPLGYVALRYFNVAGADPLGRSGQSTAGATHLIKVAAETALGKRPGMQVFGTDYETPDGTCVRDYIHVSDLAERPSRRAAPPQGRRRQRGAELRLWPRLFGVRGDRHGEARLRRRFPGAGLRPARRRSRRHRGAGDAYPQRAWLDAEAR